jgi:hypothetical protein
MTPREARQAIAWSLDKAAVTAGVSSATARLYEADPSAIVNRSKRAALDRLYDEIRTLAMASQGPGKAS